LLKYRRDVSTQLSENNEMCHTAIEEIYRLQEILDTRSCDADDTPRHLAVISSQFNRRMIGTEYSHFVVICLDEKWAEPRRKC